MLSLLALLGAAWILWNLYRSRRMKPAHALVLSGALLWLLVFFGRATWGLLLLLVGATRDLHLHRTIGAENIARNSTPLVESNHRSAPGAQCRLASRPVCGRRAHVVSRW